MSIVCLLEYRKHNRFIKNHEAANISIPVVTCESRRGFRLAISSASGGEILYFRSKEAFLTAYADATFHGKNVLAYAEERVAVDTYEEAVRQLKDNSL